MEALAIREKAFGTEHPDTTEGKQISRFKGVIISRKRRQAARGTQPDEDLKKLAVKSLRQMLSPR